MLMKRIILLLVAIVTVSGFTMESHASAATYQYMTQWGSRGTGDGQFQSPQGVAVDESGNVYIADTNNNRIQKFSPVYAITTSTRMGGDISCPTAVVSGETATCEITPLQGYAIASVTGCEGSRNDSTHETGAITYTIGDIKADCTVSATFIKTFTVTPLHPKGVKNLSGQTTSFLAPLGMTKSETRNGS